MAQLVTIFTIFAGACSVFALAVQLYVNPSVFLLVPNYITIPLSIAVTILSGYVLFAPYSRLVKNVEGKLTHFVDPESPDKGHTMVQRGFVTLRVAEKASIEFTPPFAESPHITILPTGRRRPHVLEKSNTCAIVMYSSNPPLGAKTHRWIAYGKALVLVSCRDQHEEPEDA